jgi:hypothetical protein
MERLRAHATEFIVGLAAVLTIIGFFILLPWPLWLMAVLLAVLAFLVYLLWRVSPPKIDPGDQERLDDLLLILNRRAEENIADQDFYATWNGRIMNPVKVFLYERAGVEHHFLDRRLEAKRASLYEAAEGFSPKAAQTSVTSYLTMPFLHRQRRRRFQLKLLPRAARSRVEAWRFRSFRRTSPVSMKAMSASSSNSG